MKKIMTKKLHVWRGNGTYKPIRHNYNMLVVGP